VCLVMLRAAMRRLVMQNERQVAACWPQRYRKPSPAALD
jgi:hypothetical protein